ncbi:hypothetical protein [Dactylosporangium sp. CA-233914]|uniref:hypothetical protein n=1 Tax=Dactylosporangium sp. CA-233914 TaxID=3239934 RepID=UPI003D8D549C
MRDKSTVQPVTVLTAGNDVYVFPAGDARIGAQATVCVAANLDVEQFTIPEISFDEAVWPSLTGDGHTVIDCRPGQRVSATALPQYTGFGVQRGADMWTIDTAKADVHGNARVRLLPPLDSGSQPVTWEVSAGTWVRVHGGPADDHRRAAEAGVVQP